MSTETQPRPDWSPLPRAGCENVEARVLLMKDGIVVANLRFARNATIDPHDAPIDIDVVCIAGSGHTSVGAEVFAFSAGETIRWPRGVEHCLWTTDSTMETLMVERHVHPDAGLDPTP